MICPRCHNENRAGAKFCDNCGQKLDVTCPSCEAVTWPGANYCDNCGYNLSRRPDAAPAAAPLSPVQRFLPRELAAKLEAARGSGAMEGERRIVTMLFCDVKGSTAAAERLDPEEWTEIINGAFEHMITSVYRYEGTVARLMGDGILAFFGAPIAHEDDPQRGVMAGLQIVGAIEAYRQTVQRDWDIDLNVRVGINTGLVVVGAVGSDLRMEYTAMGDAINLAARMEQTAEPGTVRVAEDTYRLVSALFDFDHLGRIEVKGKREPVPAYRALAPKAVPGKVRGIEGIEAALVGRRRELSVLRSLVEGLSRGQGQTVSIIGEAGLGKSRLITELKKLERGTQAIAPLQWFEIGATSYGRNRPYAAFQNQIRLRAGILPADGPEVAREKLGAFLRDDPRREKLQGIYERLLGLERDATFDVEGEAFKRALFDAILEATREQIGERPTVFVFDDMHWTDPASLDLEAHLVQLTRELPALFIFAFRPDRDAPVWTLRSRLREKYPQRYAEIELQPLAADEGMSLVEALLEMPGIPPALRATILDKAEGNPFFVEEIVRTLLESGLVVRGTQGTKWAAGQAIASIEIPENVQALLAARVDRLADGPRRTLQLAAVIGRTFYRRVLQAISHAPQLLEGHLQTLESAEFIYEAARVPEWEYIFRHALTQEAVYETLLLKHRREFHHRVGDALEALFPERLEELAPLLAHHFDEARQWKRAFHYHTAAGHAAYRLNAYQEAEGHYRRAVELNRLGHGVWDQIVELYRRRGRTLELLLNYDEAVANYEEMGRLGQENGHQALILAGWIALATILATFTPVHDTAQALSLSERALKLARHLINCGVLFVQIGEYEPALASLHEATSLSRAIGNLGGEVGGGFAQSLVYMERGEFGSALRFANHIVRLAKEVGQAGEIALNYINLGWLHFYVGDLSAARSFAEMSVQQSTEISFIHPYALATLARAHLLAGDRAGARQVLREAQRHLNADGWFTYHLITFLVEGDLLLAEGKIQRAVEHATGLVQKMRKYRARTWQPDALLLQAKALRAVGKDDEAYATLQTARAEAEALGARRSLWQIMAILAEVERALGDAMGAAAHSRAARDIVDYIAAHIPLTGSESDLRRSFLSLPEVQSVLSA